MPYHFLEVAVTPSVRATQADMGVDQIWLGADNRPSDTFTEDEIAFIASRDSFYMASVSETGWPYVQHRGGKAGFLRVVDQRTMAFADYRGNRQYISAGNFAANDRACLFLMDYVRRARLKIYAHVERLALDADQELTELVSDPPTKEERNGYSGFGLRRSIGIARNISSRATPNSRLNRLSLLFVNNCGNWKPRTRPCAHGWRTL